MVHLMFQSTNDLCLTKNLSYHGTGDKISLHMLVFNGQSKRLPYQLNLEMRGKQRRTEKTEAGMVESEG